MIDTFDSRALRRTDCYGQRFMKPGIYRYNVLATGARCIVDEAPFSLKVRDGKGNGSMNQHDVGVSFANGRFSVDQEELTIGAGDLVLWNCQAPKAVPFVVAGNKDFFASDRMVSECGFSHAFGSAGEFRWTDSYGSGLDGLIRVSDPDCSTEAKLKRWRKSLSEGAVVMIDGKKAEPREIDIAVGQTVFFAVVKAPGISITDGRLLG